MKRMVHHAVVVSVLFVLLFAVPSSRAATSNRLIVVTHGAAALKVDDVVAASISRFPSAAQVGLLTRFGRPLAVERLFGREPTHLERAFDEAFPSHPSALFRNALLLNYESASAAEGALNALSRDWSILHVSLDAPDTLSVSNPPSSDPFICPPGGCPAAPALPTGSSASFQWALHEAGFTKAWDVIRGHAQVGIVDSGIETRHANGGVHPDLRANFRSQSSRNFSVNSAETVFLRDVDETVSPSVSAFIGHGTHVAGIVGATSNNNLGVSGACQNCSLTIAKILSKASRARGLRHATDVGTQVINQSAEFHSGCTSGSPDFAICMATSYAIDNGVSVVTAAGNDPSLTVSSVALLPDVIGVGGHSRGGTFWQGPYPVTLYGATCCGTSSVAWGTSAGPGIVLAPAVEILSTFYSNKHWVKALTPSAWSCADETVAPWDSTPVGPLNSVGYGMCTGTSMATPFVSSVAALIRSLDPLASVSSVKTFITSTASQAANPNSLSGFGVVSAAGAAQAAIGGTQTVNRVTPLFGLWSKPLTVNGNTWNPNNHLYTSNPQMARAALNGTSVPVARHKVSPSSFSFMCNSIGAPIQFPANSFVYEASGAVLATGAFTIESTSSVPAQGLNGAVGQSTLGGVNVGLFCNSIGSTTITSNVFDGTGLFYQMVGTAIPGYISFPGDLTASTPKAVAYVFTTHLNPKSPLDPSTGLPGTPHLIPLYRLSFTCGAASSSQCTAGDPKYNPYHVSHFLTTNIDELGAYSGKDINGNDLGGVVGKGYTLDGIEGYVYPPGQWTPGSQPAGIKLLCRKYDSSRGDFILFLGNTISECQTGSSDGVSGGNYNQPEPTYSIYYLGYVNDSSAPGGIVATPPSSITYVAGNSQIRGVGATFAEIAVQVKDTTGQSMPGVTVTFTSPSTYPSAVLLPPDGRGVNVTTDSSGIARIQPVAACGLIGTYDVTASTAGVSQVVTFRLENSLGAPTYVSASSGTQQTATVTAPFATLAARLSDCGSNSLPNQSVTFTASVSGNGATATLGSPTLTDPQGGISTVPATANTKAGSYTVTPSKFGAQTLSSFSLTNAPGPAENLVGPAQNPVLSAAIQDPFPTLAVTVTDHWGNGVPGVRVTFSAPTSGPSVTFAPTVGYDTDSNGLAQVTPVANGVISVPTGTTYLVTASAVNGVGAQLQGSPFAYTLTNTAPPPPPQVQTPGFETPVVSGATNQTNYSMPPWTCLGLCGIQHNAWQTAPEGTQTAFITGVIDGSGFWPIGSISQPLNFTSNGTYKVRLKLARRPGNSIAQPIRVKMNGSQVSVISPTNSTFGQYESDPFSVQAGSRLLVLEGTNTSALNPTTLIDLVSIENVAATRCVSVVSGSGQSALGGAQFSQGLIAKVTVACPTQANPSPAAVPNEVVTFNVPGIASNPVYPAPTASVSTYTATTNAAGTVTVTATAGNMAGTYSINASVNGALVPASFNLTNLKQSPFISNASFETPPVPFDTMWWPAGAGWTFNNWSGVTDTRLNTNATPAGTQAGILMAFAQNGEPATNMTQVINFPVGGTYALSYLTALPDGTGDQGVSAYVDGAGLGSCYPGVTWMTCTPVLTFTVAPGNHTLKFQITDNNWYQYNPIMIDQITIQ